MKISYNYLPNEFKSKKKFFTEWSKLIDTTEFTLGSKVLEFEKKFANYIGVKYCISTNNGTDALILSLKSIGIGKDDEVITVTNSFYASAGAIVACGAKPVFVDCDDRYQISLKEIEKKISKKTKAIMPVHWGGASPEIEKICKLAKKHNLYVIEDACMGIGAKINNKSPGTFGIVNAFSMHPLKSLNVMGDGGMVVTNNKKKFLWLKKYRNHGMINRDKIEFWGVNMRLQPLQAVVALEGLKRIDSVIEKRNINAKYLDKELSRLYPYVILPKRKKKYLETFALYMARFKFRDKLKIYLEKKNIETKIHYPLPLHLQKPSIKMGYKKGNFPNSELQSRELLTIPVHQFLKKKQLNYIIHSINDFYKDRI